MANTPNIDLENVNILAGATPAYNQIVTEVINKANNNASKIDAEMGGVKQQINDLADNYGINVKTYYGAIGDGVSRTIAEVFPAVTLANVQAMNATATLSSQADWYVLQKAINNEDNIFIPSGNYIIDLPLTINNMMRINGEGTVTLINNIGTGHGIIVNGRASQISNLKVIGNGNSGSGMFVKTRCALYNIELFYNGRYGLEFTTEYSKHVITFTADIVNCSCNKLGGVYMLSDGGSQKNNIVFRELYCDSNGYSFDAPYGYDKWGVWLDWLYDTVNNPEVTQHPATPTTGHGMYIKGGINISLYDCVFEKNTGAGLFLDKPINSANTEVYGLYGFIAKNLYFEHNLYTHLLIDTRETTIGGNIVLPKWSDIDISGVSYNNPYVYPDTSLHQSLGDEVIYGTVYPYIPSFSVNGEKVKNITPVEKNTWKSIQRKIRANIIQNLYAIGDQFITYNKNLGVLVWDIIGFDIDIPINTSYTHSMTLQLHNVIPHFIFQFDSAENEYALTDDGTFKTGGLYYTKNGDVYTLTTEGTDWTVGSAISDNTYYEKNDSGRVANGNNNWEQSNIRQWLNSTAGSNQWFTAKNIWDKASRLDIAGFLNGMDSEFLSVLGEVKKRTTLNIDTDGGTLGGGQYVELTEKIFLLSKEEVGSTPENNMTGGVTYPYYNGITNADRIKNRIETTTYWHLRTPERGSAENNFAVTNVGSIGYVYSKYPYGIAPACVIW